MYPPHPAEDADKVVITGIGAVTPVGHDSIMAPAAIRAGISRFREVEGYMTTRGAKTVASFADGVTDKRSGNDRLLSMAVPAFREALYRSEEFYDDLDMSGGKMFLSLGAAEKPVFEDFGQEDVSALLEAAQAEGLKSAEIIREGHSGGIIAFSKSGLLLRANKAKFCVVGGMDSLVEHPCLLWLEATRRLKTDDRPRGFIPGESSAFVVLELESAAKKRGAPAICEVLETAYTTEEAGITSEKPLLAHGLVESVQKLMGSRNMRPDQLNGIICDLNGEYYRMKEWAIAQNRIFEGASTIPELWHPAANIGDIGAASAVVFSVIAAAAIQRGYFSGPKLLLWTSSDSGGRGSMLISKVNDQKR